MTTTLYPPGLAGTTLMLPAFLAGWGNTSIMARATIKTTKQPQTTTTIAFSDADQTDMDIGFRQFISLRLTPGQTITGEQQIRASIRVKEDTSSGNMFLAMAIRVMAADGVTVQKVVLPLTRDDVEADTVALTSRAFFATSEPGNYTTVDGDRLVIELGLGGDPV